MDRRLEQRAAEVFLAWLDADPAQRLGFVDRVCGGDAELRARAQALVQADSGCDGFLQLSGARDSGPGGQATGMVLTAGTMVGRYQIVRLIAAGGMGAVYEARQEHPRRMVALKVMKRGIASAGALRRFEYEAQILARLRHPNVAQVYDAGVHRDEDAAESGQGAAGRGSPYFVMEHIPEARTVTEHARAMMLDRRTRLELFLAVCDAVHHGHQRGVIHRDLKPGNILVDSGGTVKVIDFGVARLIEPSPPAADRMPDGDGDSKSVSGPVSVLDTLVVHTSAGQLIGTLQYMSPEQIDGDPTDLDLRSDVYSLGMVLYELLCNRPPYDAGSATLAEAMRVIRDEPPVRPSAHDRSLRGDVEWIVLKCLEKDRSRRYASAHELALDVRRSLRDEPVAAGPPSAVYRLRKFARRNRPLVIAAAMVIAAVTMALVATSTLYVRVQWQSARAVREGAKATEFARLLEEMLWGVEPSVALGRDTQLLEEMLSSMAKRIGASELSTAPEVEARLRIMIGAVYRDIGSLKEAAEILEPAVDMTRELHGRQSAEYSQALYVYARLLRAKGRFADALLHLEEALTIRRSIYPGDHPLVLEALTEIAWCSWPLGRFQEALAAAKEALDMSRRMHSEDHPDVAFCLHTVANGYGWLGQAAGIPYAEEALAMRRRLYPGDHPEVADSLELMGTVLEHSNRSAEALPYLEAALGMNQRLNTRDMSVFTRNFNRLRECLESLGRYEEALAAALEGLKIEQAQEEDPLRRAQATYFVALCLHHLGRASEALPLFEESLEMTRQRHPPGHPAISRAMFGLAWCLTSLGRAEEALPMFEESIEMRRVIGDMTGVRGYACGQAEALIALGRLAEAEAVLTSAWEEYISDEGILARRIILRTFVSGHIRLHEAWAAHEPGGGHTVAAAQWRARLEHLEKTADMTPQELMRIPIARP